MPTSLESRRIVIAGASSLLGAELKSLLEESRFAASDFRLVDEPIAVGTLTEAGGEPAVIQPVEEDSFDKAWIIFFAGSPAFTKTNLPLAQRGGARIVDLSGELAAQPEVMSWLPNLPSLPGALAGKLFSIPSAAAEIVARLAIAVRSLHPAAISAVAFQPISASGKAGIEELESQTGQLLSFQSIGKPVFDTQVAYTMLDRFGPASAHNLAGPLDAIRREVRACLSVEVAAPALLLLHAPVFYGTTVAACAFLNPNAVSPSQTADLAKLCAEAGFKLTDADATPSNVSSAGEITIQLAPPAADVSATGAVWFWAAADNLRLPANNAVKLAEKLLE